MTSWRSSGALCRCGGPSFRHFNALGSKIARTNMRSGQIAALSGRSRRGDEPLAGSGPLSGRRPSHARHSPAVPATPIRSATCSSRPASAPSARSRWSSSKRAARRASTSRPVGVAPPKRAVVAKPKSGVNAAEAEMDAYRARTRTRPRKQGGRPTVQAAAAAGRAARRPDRSAAAAATHPAGSERDDSRQVVIRSTSFDRSAENRSTGKL